MAATESPKAPESPKATTTKADEPKPAKAGRLARASESGDPAVHQVMAELQTARLNGDADRVSELVKRLAELGYE